MMNSYSITSLNRYRDFFFLLFFHISFLFLACRQDDWLTQNKLTEMDNYYYRNTKSMIES